MRIPLCCALALSIPPAATLPVVLAAERPNVVLIISDDQGWPDFGFMGHPTIQTPSLDRLAHESVVFTNGYVPTALCRPSLATMLTGVYPHQHKVCWNDPPDRQNRNAVLHLIGNAPTIPRLLGQAGYASLQTGKFWEGHYSNAGFTDGMSLNEAHGRHGDVGLRIGRDTMQPISDFLEKRGDQPFFLWYAPMMPHEPHNPPERLLAKYRAPDRPLRLAKYWAMCEWFDETCGQLLDDLDRRGLRDNTIVILVVDNGWIQNITTRPSIPGADWSRGFAPKSKRSPYDGGLRTPIVIRWPGRIKPQRRDDLVSTIDLAPTILSACGVKPAEAMQGLNLIDLAAGKVKPRDAVFGEIHLHTAVDVDRPESSLTHRWVRAGDWKLIWPQEDEPELYNLRNDPHEDKNLASAHPDRVAALKQRIADWWTPEH